MNNYVQYVHAILGRNIKPIKLCSNIVTSKSNSGFNFNVTLKLLSIDFLITYSSPNENSVLYVIAVRVPRKSFIRDRIVNTNV